MLQISLNIHNIPRANICLAGDIYNKNILSIGTAFGTIILHVTPESCIGGPLALVQTGDIIRLSAKNKSIDLLVDDVEIGKRKANFFPSSQQAKRGYSKLYTQAILPATLGCDFDFLTKSGTGD
jgi:dihydroxy-acid dehydratase